MTCQAHLQTNKKGRLKMERTITVRGTGSFKARPDAVRIRFTLISRDRDYAKAMELAGEREKQMADALASVEISKQDMKTSKFSIDVEKKRIDRHGVSEYVFSCYAVRQDFALLIDFDSKRLGKMLSAISVSCADPNMSVEFTVRDKDAARRAILASAAKDATVSAKTLCAELGVRLGRLVSVKYDWTEIDVYSRTDYGMGGGCAEICESAPDIEPEDVEASDSAQFEWEILERDM